MRTEPPATNHFDSSGGPTDPGSGPGRLPGNGRVFVIHGRDSQVERQMFDFLWALRLQPLEWEALVSATGSTLPSLHEVIAQGLSGEATQAVVAVLTPDDVVRLHPSLHKPREHYYEKQFQSQPRPDVLLELGGALAVCPKRTIVVEFGSCLKPISDLAGLNVIRFDGVDNREPMRKLVNRLRLAGCPVDDSGIDWGEPKWFSDLNAYERCPGSSR